MKKSEITAKYKEAVEFLDENFAYFLTHVLNIGRPQWNTTIPTACVAINKGVTDTKQFEFIFNPEFGQSLSTEDFAFVLAHETMHVLLDHLALAPTFDYPKAFNLAADAVINDYLASGGFDVPDMAVRGEKLVGFDCTNMTVTAVYNLIEDQARQEQEEMEKFLQELEEAFENFDDHEWIHNPEMFDGVVARRAVQGAPIPADLEEIRDESLNDGSTCQSLGKGDQEGTAKEFMKTHNVNLKWAELLKQLDPDLFRAPGLCPKPRSSFRQPGRKIASMYPKILLPIYEEPSDSKELRRGRDKVAITIALDTSGSIGDETARKFITLAQSIPQNKIKLFACTFTTSYLPLDLDDPKFNSGGTCFSAIEDYIQKEVIPENNGKYPSAVVVITDGEANFSTSSPADDNLKSWHWLIQDARDMNNYYVRDYLMQRFDSEQFDLLEKYI